MFKITQLFASTQLRCVVYTHEDRDSQHVQSTQVNCIGIAPRGYALTCKCFHCALYSSHVYNALSVTVQYAHSCMNIKCCISLKLMKNFPYANTIYYYNTRRHKAEDMAGTADNKGGREAGEGRKKKRFISKAFIDSSDENDSDEEREQDTKKEKQQSGEEESEGTMQNTAATTSESSSSDRSRHYLHMHIYNPVNIAIVSVNSLVPIFSIVYSGNCINTCDGDVLCLIKSSHIVCCI